MSVDYTNEYISTPSILILHDNHVDLNHHPFLKELTFHFLTINKRYTFNFLNYDIENPDLVTFEETIEWKLQHDSSGHRRCPDRQLQLLNVHLNEYVFGESGESYDGIIIVSTSLLETTQQAQTEVKRTIKFYKTSQNWVIDDTALKMIGLDSSPSSIDQIMFRPKLNSIGNTTLEFSTNAKLPIRLCKYYVNKKDASLIKVKKMRIEKGDNVIELSNDPMENVNNIAKKQRNTKKLLPIATLEQSILHPGIDVQVNPHLPEEECINGNDEVTLLKYTGIEERNKLQINGTNFDFPSRRYVCESEVGNKLFRSIHQYLRDKELCMIGELREVKKSGGKTKTFQPRKIVLEPIDTHWAFVLSEAKLDKTSPPTNLRSNGQVSIDPEPKVKITFDAIDQDNLFYETVRKLLGFGHRGPLLSENEIKVDIDSTKRPGEDEEKSKSKKKKKSRKK